MNPQSLLESRLQLHYGIQFMAATAAVLVTPEPDYSHNALEWNPEKGYFQTKPLSASSIRVALNPGPLESLILDGEGTVLSSFSLGGTTIAEGFSWLRATLTQMGMNGAAIAPLAYPPYDFPFHPIAHGGMFAAAGTEDREALARYYSISYQPLQEIAIGNPQASPIHIWPHHFDMAVLLSFPEEKSIGVGLSPGDQSYPIPYWYVTPWPYPAVEHLPPLALGSWHTQEWTGAVLTAEEMGELDAEKLQAFLKVALTASQTLLGV
ncbi:hypothetical protein [Microcoleus sp. CAWBG640]|uniref:hypothetical protein n=1 Tax=Microcoleus sp. CAWBG640 TaxID=2841653 RepID=UPI00312B89A4